MLLRIVLVCGLFVSSVVAEQIQILAAASLKFVLEDIKQEFLQTRKGDSIEISYISSGKAYAQIQNGSPAQLFIAADTEYPQKLYQANLGASAPQNYVRGKLVVFSANKDFDASTPEILKNPAIKHIAIPNAKLAPYGVAAEAYIKSAKLGKLISPKLVLGESIGQATTYVLEGSAEVGFSALSMVIKEAQKEGSPITYAIIDEKLYEPIVQALIITKAGKDSALAKDFAQYVLGSKAQEIFKSYGYDAP
ncbi:molybdate ABC transporter substrate-binding protein [uncultured Helicobacter sp.]|uniref:molybdate ABC transporter substrate-binding protein n=1 Tax=uncultured Helicobacter sp. TaxID=175537 RepID=UPI00374F755C